MMGGKMLKGYIQ